MFHQKGGGGGIPLALSQLKLQYSSLLRKYTKINFPLGKFAGMFYWEKVGQDLLLTRILANMAVGERGRLSRAGRGSEEKMVCAWSGC